MRRLAAVLVLGLAADADEVVLGSGGRISGEVVEVTGEKVVVRLPHGQAELPRRLVVEIVREEPAVYFKREAESRLRAGHPQDAVRFYRRALAAAAADPEAAAGLERSLVAWARRLLRRHRLDEARTAVEALRER
ncbi:MAG: hypothetical protein ACE5JG_05545, partial [Planctomycetota bacterium]